MTAATDLAPSAGLGMLPAAAGADDAYRRLRAENLVSFVIVSSGDVGTDQAALTAIGAFADGRFDYYEIIIAASRPSGAWQGRVRQAAAELRNVRIVLIDSPMEFEDLAQAGLRLSIGDLVACLYPGEVAEDELEAMIRTAATGDTDVVKAFFRRSDHPASERLAAGIIRFALKLITGREIQTFQARAFVVSRALLTRMHTVGGAYRFFRLFDLSTIVRERRIESATPPRRGILHRFAEKMRIASILISTSASRLILWLALVCVVLSLLSGAFGVGALVIWLVLDTVAEGWTSLAMGLSVLFAANFGVMAAICLGLLQIIRQGTPDAIELVTSEISGGGIFQHDNRLNVESSGPDSGGRGEKPMGAGNRHA